MADNNFEERYKYFKKIAKRANQRILEIERRYGKEKWRSKKSKS